MIEQGITFEFRGETVDLDKSVTKVNKDLKVLKSEMVSLNKQLKINPKDFDTLQKKFQNLQKQEEELKTKAEMYRAALDTLSEADIGGEQWTSLTKKLTDSEVALARVRNQLDKIPHTPMQLLEKHLGEIEKKLTSTGKALENVGKKLSIISGAIGALGVAGVKYNAQMEQYQVALTTLLGSEEEASRVMAQIQADAAKTPFDVDSLTQANSLLISAGIDAERSRDVILALGDAIAATGGGSAELSRMAANLQQIQNVGKATAMDIRQFANAGINIYGLLADYTGKTTEQVKDMDVSFEVLSAALTSASQEGGKYFGAMEKQSETINGTISTLKDNISLLLGELTKALLPTIKQVIGFITSLVERLQGMDEKQKSMVTTIGLILTALGPVVLMLGKLITAGGAIAGFIKVMIPKIAAMKGGIASLISPVTAVVGVLALLYATNEEFRNSVNGLVQQIGEMLKPVIETVGTYVQTYIIPALTTLVNAILPVLTGVLTVIIGIISKIVEWVGKLWTYLENRGVITMFGNAFKSLGDIISGVVNWVKDLFGWFSQLIGKAKEFLGINGQVQQSAALTDGRGIAVNYGSGGYASGGFASGGIVLNNTINVNNNGSSITTAQVMGWADLMTARINDNLGRMV